MGCEKMNMDEYGDEVEKLILTHGKTYVDKRLYDDKHCSNESPSSPRVLAIKSAMRRKHRENANHLADI